MFDFGFSEMIVVGLVALIVFGPERLPKVAKTVGALLGKAQRYVSDVKSDINRQLELDELKKLQTQVQDAAKGVEDQVRDLQSGFSNLEANLGGTLAGDPSSSSTPPSAYSNGATAMGQPAPSWTEESHARRMRSRVRDRMRERAGKRTKRY